ncbi:MAG: hypothetical protein Q4C70_02930 [Planctomycetia bacterium]|nr:hypothetical protein [Planctomycetia bacterium]
MWEVETGKQIRNWKVSCNHEAQIITWPLPGHEPKSQKRGLSAQNDEVAPACEAPVAPQDTDGTVDEDVAKSVGYLKVNMESLAQKHLKDAIDENPKNW